MKKEEGEDALPEPVGGAAKRGRPFQRGRSGNPKGRPVGSRNKAALACESLLDGEAEVLTRVAIDKAKQGDMAALRFILERVLPQRRGRSVVFDMPEIKSAEDAAKAASSVVMACAAGELSSAEASEIMGLISSFVHLIEVGEIEARLAALEQRAGPGSNLDPMDDPLESLTSAYDGIGPFGR